MKREGLGNMLEKPKMTYIARFRLHGEEEVVFTEEFDSEEDKDFWYETLGKWMEVEEGGIVEFEAKPADKKSGEDKE